MASEREREGEEGGQSARPNTETHVSGVSWHSHRITKRFRALISYNEHKYVEHGDNRSCTARPGQANPDSTPKCLRNGRRLVESCPDLSLLSGYIFQHLSLSVFDLAVTRKWPENKA